MLIEAEPRDEHDLKRWLCADGLVQIQISQMIYGRRLRAARATDNLGYDLDWCMGPESLDSGLVAWLLETMVAMIESNVSQGIYPFDGILPVSKIKPLVNDPEFMLFLISKRSKLGMK